MTGHDESFLSRWSRRKRSLDPEPPAEDAAAPAAPPSEPAEPAEERTDAEILEELGLKDPDLLEAGDDFRAFLQAAVPEHLRRRALRRLWVSNPVLANLDGLNDYDGDFTQGSVAPGMLKTAYQVGRGFVRDLAEAVDTGKADAAAAPHPPAEGGEPPPEEAAEEKKIPAESCMDSANADEDVENIMESGIPARKIRRKMRFSYRS